MFKTSKKKNNGKTKNGASKKQPNFLTQLMGIVLFFIFISAIYSLIVNKKEVTKEYLLAPLIILFLCRCTHFENTLIDSLPQLLDHFQYRQHFRLFL